MPLVHITGRTNQGKSFDIGFALVRAEKTQNYSVVEWCLRGLYSDYVGSVMPTCIVTDKEGSLKNTLKLSPYFDDIPQIIYQWHVKMNVFGKAAAMWNDKKPNTDEEKLQMRELREQFMAKFESLLHAGTTERFEELWALIQAEYGYTAAWIYPTRVDDM